MKVTAYYFESQFIGVGVRSTAYSYYFIFLGYIFALQVSVRFAIMTKKGLKTEV